MRTFLLTTAVAVAALSSTSVAAQQPCQRDNTGRIVGTVAGGGAGALLGSTIAGEGDRRLGAVIGAVGGAILGNQVAKGTGGCDRAYGYYDNQGRWNATGVSTDAARGYYDRNGQWVEGTPNGYYDQSGKWVSAGTSSEASGYRDRDGNWVPASASGYFDSRNRWVEASAPGRYDSRGRWIAGPATGSYDSRGRWIPNRVSGVRNAQGSWVAAGQPGYYDSRGRWIAGQTTGYYDARGRWIAASGEARDQRDYSYGYQDRDGRWFPNTASNGVARGYYDRNGRWIAGTPPRSITGQAMNGSEQRDLMVRYERMEERIDRAQRDGVLDDRDHGRAMAELNAIKTRDAQLRNRNGWISERNQAVLASRLDRLGSELRDARNAG
jgi:hypothetical protein